jgi:hypothetical protein
LLRPASPRAAASIIRSSTSATRGSSHNAGSAILIAVVACVGPVAVGRSEAARGGAQRNQHRQLAGLHQHIALSMRCVARRTAVILGPTILNPSHISHACQWASNALPVKEVRVVACGKARCRVHCMSMTSDPEASIMGGLRDTFGSFHSSSQPVALRSANGSADDGGRLIWILAHRALQR